jgi:ribosomal protein S18 acetylase RimI-like enzyme
VEIRRVRAEEHDALGRLTVAAYERLEGGEELGDYAKTLADVDDRARRAVVLVAVDGGELLGGVTYVAGPDNPYAEGLEPAEVGIRMLAVSPAAQGRGIGRALASECLARARRDRARRVMLHSTPWMTAAHHLYESLGFRRTPDRDRSAEPRVELLAFVLDLDVAGS